MENIFRSGEFFVGVNYWASNAGIQMWNRWDEECVKRDLDRLVKSEITVIRMFPLWSDFQPIETYRVCNSALRTISNDATKALSSPEAVAGMDITMVHRLDRFFLLCEERGIKVILGLITGWMSGRQYVPAALERLNLYTNPTALRWEIRYVKYLVDRYKDNDVVVAWDLGNECNCLDECKDKDAAFTWSCTISDAIRSIDNTRPVVSGMHSLTPEGVWTPMDQGETTDILCTHHYPAFTPLCDTDPVNMMKSANHAVAESLYYRGCGNKPCFVEEVSILGPMFSNRENACANTDMALFGLWAHDCLGYMWWCACSQSKLHDTPYDWTGLERELGLIYDDGTNEPMLDRMTAFARLTKEIGTLPKRITDAVCVLVSGQKTWNQAYGAFLLAKQAGLDIEFAWCENELPESDAYFVPGLQLYIEPTKRLWDDLLGKVKNGASLYISMDGGMMSEFCGITGFEVVSRSRSIGTRTASFDGATLAFTPMYDMKMCAKTAKVIISNEKGEPVFGVNEYGKGKVYFINTMIENHASTTPGFVDGERKMDYWRIYKAMNIENPLKVASKQNPTIGVTEHVVDDTSRYLLIINYEPTEQSETITLKDIGYHIEWVKSVDKNVTVKAKEKGSFEIQLPKNAGAVVKIAKQE